MTPAPAPTTYGVRSETAPLRRVVTATPTPGDFVAAGWRQPDPVLLLEQHAAFRALLEALGVEVLNTVADDGLVDFTFVHDSCFVVGTGFIQLAMTKPVRAPEPPRLAAFLRDEVGIPQLGSLTGPAHTDGGDMFWLDGETLAIGRGFRTSAAAVGQVRALLAPEGASVLAYDLPAWRGRSHVLHLMSVVSLVSDDLALTYPPLAPVALLEDLAARGIRTLEVDDVDFENQGCNVLAVRPGVVVMTDATPRTQALLAGAGVEVHTYVASEINKGDGGPTCLTRPVLRA